jgi:hypothetical protein
MQMIALLCRNQVMIIPESRCMQMYIEYVAYIRQCVDGKTICSECSTAIPSSTFPKHLHFPSPFGPRPAGTSTASQISDIADMR